MTYCEDCGEEHVIIGPAEVDKAIREAEPSADLLHDALLGALTTDPGPAGKVMTLLWMRRDPGKWAGYHPGGCIDIAILMEAGFGE